MLILGARRLLFLKKKWSNVPLKKFFMFSLENTGFFFKKKKNLLNKKNIQHLICDNKKGCIQCKITPLQVTQRTNGHIVIDYVNLKTRYNWLSGVVN